MNSSINIAKSLTYALLISLLVGACTQSTSSMDSTIQSLVGAVTGTPTVMPASETNPPTLEQAIADRDEQIPEDISAAMTELETEASGKIPDAVTIESQWNNAFEENLRYVTYGRDSQGRIVWQTADGTTFSEYPISWVVDRKGSHLVEGQKFGVIPDSEDAVVVFVGAGAGEKPIPVKTIVEAEDGQQYYLQYFDLQEGVWKLNAEVLAVLDENLQDLQVEVINPYLAIAMDNQATYVDDEIEIKGYFDLSKQEWIFSAEGKPMKFINNMDGIEGRTAIITTLTTVDETATIQPPTGTINFPQQGNFTTAGIKHFSLKISNINVGGYKIEEIVFNPGPNQIRMPELHLWGAYRGADGEKHILEIVARDGWKPSGEDTTFKITEDSMEETYSPGTKMSAFLAVVAQENSAARFRNWLEENNLTRSIYMLGGFGDIPLTSDELTDMLLNPATEWVKLPLDLVMVLTINPRN